MIIVRPSMKPSQLSSPPPPHRCDATCNLAPIGREMHSLSGDADRSILLIWFHRFGGSQTKTLKRLSKVIWGVCSGGFSAITGHLNSSQVPRARLIGAASSSQRSAR